MNWQRTLVGADRPFGPGVGMSAAPHLHEPRDVPAIGPRGRLTYRGHTVFLSERNALLAGVLVYHFESDVTDTELLDRVWPEGATRRTLRRRLSQLTRRLARIGLAVAEESDGSHVLRPAEPAVGSGLPAA